MKKVDDTPITKPTPEKIKTEEPLSEKDEVKVAEQKMRERKKPSQEK